MPHVLELHRLGLTRRHRPGRVEALQRLHAGFFIQADHMHARLVQFFRLMIKSANRPDLLAKRRLIVHLMVKPVLDPVRLEVRLILKTRVANSA